MTREVHCFESEAFGLVLLNQEMRPELAAEIVAYIRRLEGELQASRERRFRDVDDLLTAALR